MELNLVLEVISTVAVIIGIIFGLNQLQQYRLSRKRDSGQHLLNSFTSSDYVKGIWIILSLPDGLTKKEIEERVGEEINLIYLVMSTWESIGILVFHHEFTMDMVDDAYSGPIVVSWKKLELYVTEMRKEHQRETMFEWFQWLADRMRDREQTRSPVPAHIAYKEWDE